MKNTWIKGLLAIMMLLATWSGLVGSAGAAANTAPIMRDNLSKFGLKKEVELPATVTADGLSYTLEKVMIYDVNSSTAKALMKKYGYTAEGNYFIWTKITIENKGKTSIEQTSKSPDPKWTLFAADGGMFAEAMPSLKVRDKNSKEALWDWTLKPGQKLSTYQGLFYNASVFDYFAVRLNVKGKIEVKYIVDRKE